MAAASGCCAAALARFGGDGTGAAFAATPLPFGAAVAGLVGLVGLATLPLLASAVAAAPIWASGAAAGERARFFAASAALAVGRGFSAASLGGCAAGGGFGGGICGG